MLLPVLNLPHEPEGSGPGGPDAAGRICALRRGGGSFRRMEELLVDSDYPVLLESAATEGETYVALALDTVVF